jgi:CRISPR-associated RAMP protein (TIGR02581 family)
MKYLIKKKRLTMFEKLESRFFFTGNIILENELHIGSGKGDGSTDALFIRDNRDAPFIPGSSLRGSLRSTIERIVSSMGMNPCLLIKGNQCISISKKIQDDFNVIKNDPSKISEIKTFISNVKNVCPICQLFGSTFAASKIKISDLQIQNSSSYYYGVRDCVAIDRDTETAKDGAKFDFQTIDRKSIFKFELIGENLNARDLRLLAVGIQEMVSGNFWLGGNTSRGLGKCKLENLLIEYFNTPDLLKKYLTNKELNKLDNDKFFKLIDGLVPSQGVKIHA